MITVVLVFIPSWSTVVRLLPSGSIYKLNCLVLAEKNCTAGTLKSLVEPLHNGTINGKMCSSKLFFLVWEQMEV